MSESFWRKEKVKETTGLGHTSIYEGAAEGTFPPPIKISERSSAWCQSEIEAWQRWRIALSEGRAGVTSSWRDFIQDGVR